MKYLFLVLKGIVLGVANVIPGVSGGTMAVVFNVYDKIIDLITPNIKKILRSWKFWVPLALGMGIGIFVFSKIITLLLNSYPVPTTFFFIGLIAGSIPLVWKKTGLQKTGGESSLSAARKVQLALCFAVGVALVLCMMFFGFDDSAKDAAKASAASLSGEFSFKVALMLFFAGAAAAIAMIIPGISGSFLLLALGMYAQIMGAIATLNVPLLVPFALGVMAGLIFGAALVRLLMAKAPSHTYSLILGLVAGSVLLLFVGVTKDFAGGVALVLFSVLTLAAGFAAAFFSSRSEN